MWRAVQNDVAEDLDESLHIFCSGQSIIVSGTILRLRDNERQGRTCTIERIDKAECFEPEEQSFVTEESFHFLCEVRVVDCFVYVLSPKPTSIGQVRGDVFF